MVLASKLREEFDHNIDHFAVDGSQLAEGWRKRAVEGIVGHEFKNL